MTRIDIRKNQDYFHFTENLSVEKQLRDRQVDFLAISDVAVTGQVTRDGHIYMLTYQMTYQISLPSTRSLACVERKENHTITELFAEPALLGSYQEELDDALILPLENDSIDLTESVIDNILLHLPLQVLTPEEEASDTLPKGSHWTVLTQEQYQAQQSQKKAQKNPFAVLDGLLDDKS